MTHPENDTHDDSSPMDHERCLFVLGQVRDGRPQPAALVAEARDHAAAHPEVARIDAEFAALGEALAGLPELTAAPEFTDRVLAARREQAADREPAVSIWRRTAAAAAIVLGVALAYDAGQPPVDTLADESTDRPTFEADAFRSDPYSALDLDAGLEALMPGPLDDGHDDLSGGSSATEDSADGSSSDDHGQGDR